MPSCTGSLRSRRSCCSRAQLVVAEQLLGPGRRRLVVARVVGHAGHGGERELVVLDPVLLADLEGVDPDLGGQLVHEPLDGVGRLGTAGPAVGVGPRLVGEHVGAVELVGRELVDGVEHEGAEDRDTGRDEAEVGAHVGEQVDLEPGDGAVLGGREGELLPLVAAVVGRQQRLAAGLGVLARLAGVPRRDRRHGLLRGVLELAAEAATDVRRDDPHLALGDAEGRER